MQIDMRKILFVLMAVPSVAAAQPSYQPLFPRGGLDSTTKLWAGSSPLDGLTLAEWAASIDANSASASAAQVTANAAIPLTQKGAASGIAALDANGNVTSQVDTLYKVTGGTLAASANVLLNTDTNFVTSGHGRIEYPRLTDTDNVGADVLMGGGHSANDIMQMKLTGMNTSGGDEGGVVYEFDDMQGVQGGHRNGAGSTDGINVAASISNNAPVEVLGGGTTSSDGVAYTITYPNGGEVCATPGLSTTEMSFFRNRMRLWTNYANGMANTEGAGDALDDGRYDLPNYYYGYNAGAVVNTTAQTCWEVQNYYYPGTGDTSIGFRTILSSSEPSSGPGSNSGDTLDNKISGNTNYKSYTSAALMLGGNEKDFNLYTLEEYKPTNNSLTRNYDNEFDHFIEQDHDKEVVTRGVTYSWASSTNHPFADGSYGMRIAGFDLMPVGATIDGIQPAGGVAITTNGGFNIFRNLSALSSTTGSYISGSTLGFVGDTAGYNQLNYYSSVDSSGDAGSVHLGLVHATSTGLENNRDAGCADTKWITGDSSSLGCSFQGQLIYNPAGYSGGVALGSGMGSSTKIAIVAKSDGAVEAPSSITTPSINIANTTSTGTAVGSIYGDIYGNMIFNESNFVFLGDGSSFQVHGNADFSGTIQIPFGTPASSTAACTQGQIEMDATYTYSCVASNTWHRVSNGATW